MIAKEDLHFDKEVYEKAQKAFRMAEQHLGIKLLIHAEDSTLESGQIYLFNHFTRFETVIPAYIFYQRFGEFTRTIADHQLFNLNPRFDSFLCGSGAVPNNLPGLLPFLAAELLKGRRVVIFPEGKMIKDKRVMNEEGLFRIFSESNQTYHKHHRGAAVLAWTLELFKRRINNLLEKRDTERLQHWCSAVGFSDIDELKLHVQKPTLIVPGTITFNPLRVGGNFLSRAIRLLDRDFSEKLLEEVIIEGNILFKDTDMDIRFGKPLAVDQKWQWWKKKLLDNYFLSIDSLEEFFSLRDRAKTWSEQLLANLIYKETTQIRDEYIKKMYQGITVNISHIASVLIYVYLEKGEREVKQKEFHKALYFAVKALQNKPDIHLSHYLDNPENYSFLDLGDSPRFTQFIDTARITKLIEKTADSYILLSKLEEKRQFKQVRRENPVLVYINEVSPVVEVGEAVHHALAKAKMETSPELAYHLWDDELRAFAWNTEKFCKLKYDPVSQYEIPYQPHAPFLLSIEQKTKTGILLVHGFLSSPAELLEYGEHINRKGFNVLGLRLAGHGTSPCDLNERMWEEWLESVRRNYEILCAFCEEIIIVGFSVGGTLALLLASEKHAHLKAVITVCAALEVQDKGIHLAQAMDALNKVAALFPKIDGLMNYKRSNTRHLDTNYHSMPVHALSELNEMMKVAQKKVETVYLPILVIQSDKDNIVAPKSADIIMEKLGSTQKKVAWIESDSHDLVRENIQNTWELMDKFILAQSGHSVE